MSSDNKAEKAEFHQQIPADPGRKSAIVLAGLMHVLLVLFLWIGIHWQSKTPVGVEAEIWDVNTRAAAPRPVPQYVPPVPEVKKSVPEPVAQEQEQEAEIAIERAREKKRIEQKRLEEQEAKRKEEKQKEEKQKEDLLKAEKKKQELAKLAEQKKADALLAQQRNDNLKRLINQTANQLASQSGGTGDAVKSTGNNRVDPGYAGRIAAKIKSNMVYVGADSGSENPTADFVINLFPDGSLKGAPRKTKSSGVPAFDDAVERAITKSAPYPADKSGNVPSTIPLTYRLKD